jgi:hypothetical protein
MSGASGTLLVRIILRGVGRYDEDTGRWLQRRTDPPRLRTPARTCLRHSPDLPQSRPTCKCKRRRGRDRYSFAERTGGPERHDGSARQQQPDCRCAARAQGSRAPPAARPLPHHKANVVVRLKKFAHSFVSRAAGPSVLLPCPALEITASGGGPPPCHSLDGYVSSHKRPSSGSRYR